jgi:P-type E1-E2 ATPase
MEKFILNLICPKKYKKGRKILFLEKRQIESYILSGDKVKTVEKIAQKINVKLINCYASLLPEEKLQILEKMQIEGKKILAIGDGVNDAAMLAKAHISIAAHGGTDIALQSADIFLRKQGLNIIQKTITYCDYVKNTLRILIAVSLLYNLFAIFFAVLGYVNPLFAALFMPISSLTVYLIVFFRRGNKIWL